MATTVKSHARSVKGKGNTSVKRHSRVSKGKNSKCSSMSMEMCKEKYAMMVEKYGKDSPQAEKMAMKMESMDTVEKSSRMKKVKKYSRESSRTPIDEEILVKNAKKKFGDRRVSKKVGPKGVDAIYAKTPELDNPNYKKKIHRGTKMGTSVISIAADKKRYRVASNGKTPDTWHEVKKYGTKKSRKK
jgi:hypothetical protein